MEDIFHENFHFHLRFSTVSSTFLVLVGCNWLWPGGLLLVEYFSQNFHSPMSFSSTSMEMYGFKSVRRKKKIFGHENCRYF
jgi:hypothetical protein